MIEISVKQIDAAAKALGQYKAKLPNVLAMSINKGIRVGRTTMSQLVRAEFRVKQKDLYSALAPVIRFANAGSLSGRIGAQWAGMLKTWDFHVSPRGISNPAMGEGSGRKRRRRGGSKQAVSVAVKTGGGATITRGFVAAMASGHIGVFQRYGSSRLPIRELHSISAPFMVSPEKTKTEIEYRIEEAFNNELERQVARFAG